VRLTLRTLLAYLDDTLEPSETKAIGQKVAESDQAQELIARIKQVTRRRRLTTPPTTGPNAFEPNTVAEYLDNALSPEQMVEIEKSCLESDVHLAEIAAVHQILTLVLGQPALVPPTAKQRMYALVHGRKASRARPAAAATANGAAAADSHAEDDETLLLGLPHYRSGAAMRWLLPLAAVLLLVVIAGALWKVFPFGNDNAVALVTDTGKALPEDTGKAPQGTGKEGTPGETNTGQKPTQSGVAQSSPVWAEMWNSWTNGGSKAVTTPVQRLGPPSQERREVGVARRTMPGVLAARATGADPWQIVKAGARVPTRSLFVSLPGYKSDLRLDTGVDLTLWGSVYEFMSAFLESAIVLHAPPPGLDVDFTLDRGAVLITNRKEAKAEVLIRLQDEKWHVTLEEPDAEVGVALLGRYVTPYGSGDPPRADGFLLIRKGRVSVRVDPYREYSNLEPSREGRRAVPLVIFWDNEGKGAQKPVPVPRDPQLQMFVGVFDSPPQGDLDREEQKRSEAAQAALDGVSLRLSMSPKIEATLVEMLQKGEPLPLHAVMAVRCLGALDAVADLVNVLDDADKDRSVRVEAINALRHWIGRDAGQEAILYDPRTQSGALIKERGFVPTDAVTFMELLHTPGQQQLDAPAYWASLIDDLKSDRLAIRELGFFHLRRWVRDWQTTGYDPTGTPEARRAAYDAWKKLIPDGKLPPSRPR
jgi:hypothetical protein